MKRIIAITIGICLIATFIFAAQDVNIESLKISIKSTIVSVTTSATALPATALSGRKSITIQNLSGSTVYIGDSNVTADTTPTGGLQIRSTGDTFTADFADDIIVYGIVASGSQPTAVLEAR